MNITQRRAFTVVEKHENRVEHIAAWSTLQTILIKKESSLGSISTLAAKIFFIKKHTNTRVRSSKAALKTTTIFIVSTHGQIHYSFGRMTQEDKNELAENLTKEVYQLFLFCTIALRDLVCLNQMFFLSIVIRNKEKTMNIRNCVCTLEVPLAREKK